MIKREQILKYEAKEIAKQLENVSKGDKKIIMSALQGMLLVAEVNKNKKKTI